MGISELVMPVRDVILGVAARHGGRHVRVIGSMARGDAHPDSDLDLLIDFEGEKSLFDQARLVLELEQAIGRKVDVATVAGLDARYRAKVLSEAVSM